MVKSTTKTTTTATVNETTMRTMTTTTTTGEWKEKSKARFSSSSRIARLQSFRIKTSRDQTHARARSCTLAHAGAHTSVHAPRRAGELGRVSLGACKRYDTIFSRYVAADQAFYTRSFISNRRLRSSPSTVKPRNDGCQGTNKHYTVIVDFDYCQYRK